MSLAWSSIDFSEPRTGLSNNIVTCIYDLLWLKGSANLLEENQGSSWSFSIPDTIVYKRNSSDEPLKAQSWFFSSRHGGAILKKNRQNIQPAKILHSFAPNPNKQDFDLAATFFAIHYKAGLYNSEEYVFNRPQQASTISDEAKIPDTQVTATVLDRNTLSEFVSNPTWFISQLHPPLPPPATSSTAPDSLHASNLDVPRITHCGVLQKISQTGRHSHVIKARWTPSSCSIHRATNARPLWDLLAPGQDRYICVPYDTPNPPAVIVSSILGTVFPERVRNTCNAIADHIQAVTLGHCVVSHMGLYFSTDTNDKLLFLWCDELLFIHEGLEPTNSPSVTRALDALDLPMTEGAWNPRSVSVPQTLGPANQPVSSNPTLFGPHRPPSRSSSTKSLAQAGKSGASWEKDFSPQSSPAGVELPRNSILRPPSVVAREVLQAKLADQSGGDASKAGLEEVEEEGDLDADPSNQEDSLSFSEDDAQSSGKANSRLEKTGMCEEPGRPVWQERAPGHTSFQCPHCRLTIYISQVFGTPVKDIVRNFERLCYLYKIYPSLAATEPQINQYLDPVPVRPKVSASLTKESQSQISSLKIPPTLRFVYPDLDVETYRVWLVDPAFLVSTIELCEGCHRAIIATDPAPEKKLSEPGKDADISAGSRPATGKVDRSRCLDLAADEYQIISRKKASKFDTKRASSATVKASSRERVDAGRQTPAGAKTSKHGTARSKSKKVIPEWVTKYQERHPTLSPAPRELEPPVNGPLAHAIKQNLVTPHPAPIPDGVPRGQAEQMLLRTALGKSHRPRFDNVAFKHFGALSGPPLETLSMKESVVALESRRETQLGAASLQLTRSLSFDGINTQNLSNIKYTKIQKSSREKLMDDATSTLSHRTHREFVKFLDQPDTDSPRAIDAGIALDAKSRAKLVVAADKTVHTRVRLLSSQEMGVLVNTNTTPKDVPFPNPDKVSVFPVTPHTSQYRALDSGSRTGSPPKTRSTRPSTSVEPMFNMLTGSALHGYSRRQNPVDGAMKATVPMRAPLAGSSAGAGSGF